MVRMAPGRVYAGLIVVVSVALLIATGPWAAAATVTSSHSSPSLAAPTTWRNMSGAQPPFEQGAPMAYDPLLHAVVLVTLNSTKFACQMYTYSYVNATWTNLTSTVTGSPGVTQHAGFVYDVSDHYMLLFGGYDNCNGGTGGTWSFSNGTWSQIHTTQAPPVTEGFGMAYDAHDGYVVLYGGPNTGTDANRHQTWTYHAGVWTHLNTTLFPAAAQSVQMAPESGGGVLLYGGGVGTTYNPLHNATWTFIGGGWHKLYPAAVPPATTQGLMEYCPPLGDVLFDGYQAAVGYENYTYLYSGGTWTNLTSTLAHSPPIAYAEYSSGACNRASGHIIEFLSPNGAGTQMSTWALV
jgi:hypothetical protein